MSTKLSPQARRLRTIIVTIPIMAATSLVLYERLVLGKPRRTVDRSPEKEGVPMIPDDEFVRQGLWKGEKPPESSHS